MDQTYTQKEVDELLKRVAQIKIDKVDYEREDLKGFAEFLKDFKLYTQAAKDNDLSKYEKELSDVNQEMQGLKVHINSLQKQLEESGVISGIKVFDERFPLYEEFPSVDWEEYKVSAILPSTKNCDEMTLDKNFEQELEKQILSFKDDSYQIKLEIVNLEKQLAELKLQKQNLKIIKDAKKRKELSKKISNLKVFIERDNKQLDRLSGGLEVLQAQQERILSIAPEDRMMIEQLIEESIYLNTVLESRHDKLITECDSTHKTSYPYSILSFFKLFPNATKHLETLKNLAIYLETNGVSNRDINGYRTFHIEKYVDFAPCNGEMMLLLNELNDDVFRKTLGLQPLPQKTEQYTKTDYLMDRDLSFGE